MLSTILFASIKTKKEPRSDRAPGLSCSGLFPCAYRIYKVHLGQIWNEELLPQQALNLEDGWENEEKTIKRLSRAGVEIGDRQHRVKVGKSGIPGSIDGTFTLNGKKRLWEHKGWNTDRFLRFRVGGLSYYPGEKSQVNAYMLGMGLDETEFMVLCKENNDYHDIVEKLDRTFIEPIIEWADAVRLENWIPEPKLCSYCAYCGLDCFGTVLDLSRVLSDTDADSLTEKWIKSKQYLAVGGMLEDEVRQVLIGVKDKQGNLIQKGLIGDKDLLLVGGLQVKKVMQHRIQPSKHLIMEKFGPEVLLQISEESDITTYRITERKG